MQRSLLVILFLLCMGFYPEGLRAQTFSTKNLYINNIQPLSVYESEGFKPRKDLAPYRISLPLDWSDNPFSDRNWQFQKQAWRMIDPYLHAYSLKADEALLYKGFEYIADWSRYHLVEGKTAGMDWDEMSAGVRAMILAFYIDAEKSGKLHLSARDHKILMAVASAHLKRLEDASYIKLNNHGLFQVVGLKMLCLSLPASSQVKNAEKVADRVYSKIMHLQYTDEGIHKEHSPAYHYFVTKIMTRLKLTALFSDEDTNKILEKAINNYVWLTYPNRKIIPVGDSSGTGYALSSVDEDVVEINKQKMLLKDFSDSGYVVYRTHPKENRQRVLFFTGMKYSQTHKHNDELSFVLFDDGYEVFTDSGKFGYTSQKMRGYVISYWAHNTLGLSDEPFERLVKKFPGSCIQSVDLESKGVVIKGESEHKKFIHARTLFYELGKSLQISDSVLNAREPLKISSFLHLGPKVKVTQHGDSFELLYGKHKAIVEPQVNGNDCKVRIARGEKKPLLGWVSKEYLKAEPTNVLVMQCVGENMKLGWSVTFAD